MQTYCLGYKKDTDNIDPEKVTLKNRAIKDKSRYANCMPDNSGFLKQNHN